ncbi:MAG: hypothetical protein GX193_09820 [Clostridiales bacterium]|nr:hypothetical protein [Clostridiales bacterium]
MKRKCIYIISMAIFMLVIGLFFLPNDASAASPPATLTVDGVPVGTYPSVQEAVNAIETTPGVTFVVEIANGTVTDRLQILQHPDKNVVVKPQAGAIVTFTNTITIDGNGNYNNPEYVLIQGLNFDFSAGSPAECIDLDFVDDPQPPGRHCYPHNVTINGCTFKGVLDQVVAVQSTTGGMRNIAIMNCTATDMHSLAQLKAVGGYAFIQNCTLTNSSGGVNFYGTANLYVDSCNFSVVGYAVRSGQGGGPAIDAGSVNINNSILKSNSIDDGTVVLRGDSSRHVYIVHSILANENADGPSIQNVTAGNLSLYDIHIVETDVTGHYSSINPTTIKIIDDPNVKNGPVSIIENGDDCSPIKKAILQILKIVLTIIFLPFILIYYLIKWLFPGFAPPF